jgi:hypothetical protein
MSSRRAIPAGAARLGPAILVALILLGCLVQMVLLRDEGNYGAVVGEVPDFCIPAATARALDLREGPICR